MAAEALDEYINSQAPAGVKDKVAVNEEILSILKYESQQGIKLGEFEVAYQQNNIAEKFKQGFEVLSKSNATIQSRYYGKEYAYSYWIYTEGKIYRQKLKKTGEKPRAAST
jgi:hypothetical protein